MNKALKIERKNVEILHRLGKMTPRDDGDAVTYDDDGDAASDTTATAAPDMRLSFIFASPGPVRGDSHQLLPGAWSKNWKGQPGDGLTNIRRNPVVLPAHDATAPAVGKITAVTELPDGRLAGSVEFANTPDGAKFFRLYRDGFMSAVSIGWAPIEATRSTDPARGYNALDVKRAELLELSLVAVPADANALVLGRSHMPRVYPQARTADEFDNIGRFTQALARFAGGDTDRRLTRAPTGLGETSGTGGGFLVPAVLGEPIFETIFSNRNSALSYFRRLTIPDGANAIKVPGVDETSRANGYRWGGVSADFIDEGILQTNSFPRLKETTFAAEKMLALVPISGELLADAENLTNYLTAALADEIAYKLEQYTLTSAGTGAGKPLSVLKGPALLTMAAVGGQKPASIVYDNLTTMWNALPSASRKSAIWVASESAARQLLTNGAAAFPGFYPNSGATNPDDLPRLFGRPVVECDALPTVGTVGDILLVDPLWYGLATKPMAVALSAEVGFLSQQAYLRVVLRCDANPLVSAPLTASDATQRSPFVALGAR